MRWENADKILSFRIIRDLLAILNFTLNAWQDVKCQCLLFSICCHQSFINFSHLFFSSFLNVKNKKKFVRPNFVIEQLYGTIFENVSTFFKSSSDTEIDVYTLRFWIFFLTSLPQQLIKHAFEPSKPCPIAFISSVFLLTRCVIISILTVNKLLIFNNDVRSFEKALSLDTCFIFKSSSFYY